MKVLQRRLLPNYGFFKVEERQSERLENAQLAYEIGEGRRGQNYYLIVDFPEYGDEIRLLATEADGCGSSTPFTQEFFELLLRLRADGVIS